MVGKDDVVGENRGYDGGNIVDYVCDVEIEVLSGLNIIYDWMIIMRY